MTLYARSDLVEVTIPTGNGGCGLPHRRPVVDGAPAKVFALDCVPCETSIRAEVSIREAVHPLWSGTISGVPETPDEKAQREDEDKRGQREAAGVNRAALESLSTLPQVLTQMTALLAAGQLPAIGQQLLAATVTCSNGHANLGAVKFCGECGAYMSTVPPVTLQVEPATGSYTRGSIATVAYDEPEFSSTTAPVDIADTSTLIETESLNDKPLAVLRETARAAGLPTKRSKAEQIAVLEGRAS